MTNNTGSLLKLMAWLSPVFPTGGFAYSAGLEQAVADGAVTDADALQSWISTQITRGSLWNDAVLFAAAHESHGNMDRLSELADLARALCLSSERLAETVNQGKSFHDAASHWFGDGALPARGTPLPIVVGAAAGASGIERQQAIAAYLHTFATNQLQCAIRLSVSGQDGAAKCLAALGPVVAETASRAASSTLDDLGTAAFLADIASMNHETLQARLFLS